MDLGSAVRLLLRRWWVLVVGVVLTLGVTGYFYTQAQPRYQATANMILLLQPDARGAEEAGSPFLYLPNGLITLASIVVVGPESREFRQSLFQQGLTSQFELGVQVGSPIISVSVEGTDPANVIATRDKVIEGLQEELAAVQKEEQTPERQIAHTRVYGSEDVPTLLSGDRLRGILVAMAVGGLLTLMVAFAVDRLALMIGARRRRRKEARQTEPSIRHRRRSAPADTADMTTSATVSEFADDFTSEATSSRRRSGLRRPALNDTTAAADRQGKGADSVTVRPSGEPGSDGLEVAGNARVRASK